MKRVSILLALSVLALTFIGLVTIYSVSSVEGISIDQNPYKFIKNQFVFFIVALMIATAVYTIPIETWFSKGMVYILVAAAILGLVLVFIPEIGVKVNGSRRWIQLPGFRIQTSEFIKLITIILLARWEGMPWRNNKSFKEGIFYPCIGLGFVFLGLMLQPDFGSTIMLGCICSIIMLTSGVNFRYFVGAAILAIIPIIILVIHDPERIMRVTPIFQLNTQETLSQDIIDNSLYQVRSAISALRHGGVSGIGLGHSIFKEHYTPEYHTDFILSMIGEELGILGTSLVVLLIVIILICGLYISYKTEHFQYRLLALGMSLQISLYAIVNTGIVCGFLPTKGLAMPFLSYGGSNLLSSYIAVGFLLAIARYVRNYEESEENSQHDPSFWNM